MSEWREVTLAELGKFSSGKPITPGQRGEFNAYGANGVIGGSDEARYGSGIIVGRVGAYCGAVAVSHEPFWASDNTIVIEPAIDDDLDYLGYLLRSAHLHRYAGGAAQPLVTQGILKALRFRVPEPNVRVRIGRVLADFDDLIENNRRRVEILEEMARSIYREWFVKFRYPGHEDVCMINSTLGPIPEDWSVAPLLRVADVRYGRGLAKKEMRPGEIPVYGAAKVIGSHDTATVFERTIVMGCRGSCGQVAITSAPAFVTNNSFTIVPKAGFGKLWLYRFLEHRGVAEFIGGSAQPQITLDSISGLDLYVPNAGLITAFEAAIGPLDAAAWHLGRSSRRLEEIRDQLLPKLVTGQIDVSTLDLDALVSEQVA